jgi:hypothetical protein
MVEKDLRAKRMEPILKDQPKQLVTRMLMVTFGPWDRASVRSHATLARRELKALIVLLFACAVVLPHLVHDHTSRAIFSSGIYVLLLIVFLRCASWMAARHCAEDPSAFFNGAVIIAACLAPVTLVIPEVMPPGAREAMAIFAGAWMGLRLSRIRPLVEDEERER